MLEEKKIRQYKNDEFKINYIYNENGKTLPKIIEEAFKNYHNLKMNN